MSFSSSVSEKASWTMHTPGQSSMSRPVLRASQPPRCLSGPKMIFCSGGICLRMISADEEVTMMSLSAFTSAELLM